MQNHAYSTEQMSCTQYVPATQMYCWCYCAMCITTHATSMLLVLQHRVRLVRMVSVAGVNARHESGSEIVSEDGGGRSLQNSWQALTPWSGRERGSAPERTPHKM